jgi:Tfp pilus assembly protein PilF
MPSTTYMQVDARRDHSFRIPRPDVSDRLGTPNACTACHTERPARWAAAQITAWRGGDTTSHGLQRFADALAAAEGRVARAQPLLQGVATDSTQPAIPRATALAELAAPTDRATLGVVGRGLSDPDPLVRLGALRPVWQFPPERRAVFVAPLLADTMRVIRIDAAGVHPGAALTTNADEKTAFEHAADEFIASQRYNADRADARTNLGTFFAVQQRDAATAGSELLAAIRIDPFFVPAYANLADVYRAQGGDRDADAERILRAGLVLAPRSAALHHALGLALVRRRQLPAAVAELQRAASLEPTNLRFTYTYAVALYSTGKVPAAIAALDRILAVDENYRDALAAMVGYLGTQGKLALAKRYSDRLRELASRDVSR